MALSEADERQRAANRHEGLAHLPAFPHPHDRDHWNAAYTKIIAVVQASVTEDHDAETTPQLSDTDAQEVVDTLRSMAMHLAQAVLFIPAFSADTREWRFDTEQQGVRVALNGVSDFLSMAHDELRSLIALCDARGIPYRE